MNDKKSNGLSRLGIVGKGDQSVRGRTRLLFVLCLSVSWLAGCGIDWLPVRPAASLPAYWPTDGWRASTPEEQGLDAGRLDDMLALMEERAYRIDGIVVVRNGYLVLEVYNPPLEPGETHVVNSCTKSVISALVGIAIDQGAIQGLDQKVLDFFPTRTAANLDVRKEAMTLEDVLTMSTGLECRDSYLYRWRGFLEMTQSRDWIQHVLDLPMVEDPGIRFEYCNGASYLLSAIIQQTTGMNARAYAEEYLFGPLGITELDWPASPEGITYGWGELHLTPRDMAKIGYLYLNEGQWAGQQIVSAEWVKASTRRHISATLQDGYGYQWWVDASGYYMALGYAGQFIFVVPEQDLVVAVVSDLPESQFYVPQQLLEGYILLAIQSTGAGR